MPAAPLRLIVLARDQSPRVQDEWKSLAAFLANRGDVEIAAASVTEDLDFEMVDADLSVVLGGDGAILRACRQMGKRQLPILGVNLGRLGFLADLSPAEFRQQIEAIVTRQYRVVDHLMFECTHHRLDGSSESWLGLNEVAVVSGGSLEMIPVQLWIDGGLVTTYSSDGLIISTPVGSTAHSLSAGGPILRQDMQAFVVTPICPHTLSNRPIVDRADYVYTMLLEDVPDGVRLVIDGQISRPARSGDRIEVRQSDVSFRLARMPGDGFYSSLQRKLGWGGQPRYQPK